MKMFFVLISCLAVSGMAFAEPATPHKGKKKAAAQVAPPHAQGGAPGIRSGGGPHVKPISRNVSTAPFHHGPAVQAHVNKLQSKKFALANKPNPKIAAVKFHAGHQIQGSQNWHGAKYVAFKNYRAQWHDRNWWHNHHNRIVFVFGAPYFWDAGWWYPAWGYDPNAYYAYDGPIYGYNDLPPDQVVANVQSALQEQGYYTGEVDGLLGPLTRAAIARYQQDHGLYTTSAIDEPTLEALGMA